MEEQNQEKEEGLEFLDLEPEIKEFVRKTSTESDYIARLKPQGVSQKQIINRKKRARARARRGRMNPLLSVLILLAAVVGTALCGILWLELPPSTVLIVIVLEEVLAVCLRNTPVWLHLLVVIGNIILGVAFDMVVFLLLANLVYLSEIVTAYYRRR